MCLWQIANWICLFFFVFFLHAVHRSPTSLTINNATKKWLNKNNAELSWKQFVLFKMKKALVNRANLSCLLNCLWNFTPQGLQTVHKFLYKLMWAEVRRTELLCTTIPKLLWDTTYLTEARTTTRRHHEHCIAKWISFQIVQWSLTKEHICCVQICTQNIHQLIWK